MKVRVLLVGGDAAARERLRALLGAQPDVEVVVESDMGTSTFPAMRWALPDRAFASGPVEWLAVKKPGRIQLRRTEEIDWIESAGNYVSLHSGGTTQLLRETMAALERRLDDSRFVRVHRTAIVRIDRIDAIHRGARGRFEVVLRDGTRLALSRRHRGRLVALLEGGPSRSCAVDPSKRAISGLH